MSELHVSRHLDDQVAARHLAAADDLSSLVAPDLGPGPGTLAMLRIFAAVMESTQELAVTSEVTADAVRQVAHTLADTDLDVRRRLEGLS